MLTIAPHKPSEPCDLGRVRVIFSKAMTAKIVLEPGNVHGKGKEG
jgi:hypothetical protein